MKDAVDAFLRFTDKPILATKDAVTVGLSQACRDGLIGLARGPSIQNLQAKYCRQDVSVDSTEDGLWIIPPFEPEVSKQPVPSGEDFKTGGGPGPQPTPSAEKPSGGQPGIGQKKLRKLTLRGSVPLESYGELFRCFVAPAARMDLKKLNIAVQLDLEAKSDKPLDPNDGTLKAMNEAARQLGLTFETEE